MAYKISGTITPDATGLYLPTAAYNGYATYTRYAGGWFLWVHKWSELGSDHYRWVISQEVGVLGTGWDQLWPWVAPEDPEDRSYYATYGASGTPTVAPAAAGAGSPIGGEAAVAGAGSVEASGTGSVIGGRAAAAGVGAVEVSGTGSAIGSGPRIAGRDFSVNTGRVTGGKAAVRGIATGPLVAAGSAVGGEAAVAGVGTVSVSGSGAVGGQKAIVSGSALATVAYYVDARGVYRVFNEAEYRFYRSNSAPPAEDDAAWDTDATLPHEPTDTFSDGTWWIACAWFNGVLSSGFLPVGPAGETYLRIDVTGGTETENPPPGPIDWRLEARPAGVVRVHAVIYLAGETTDPDEWALSYTTNGSAPAEDAPDVTQALRFDVGGELLQYDLPAQANGTTVKVRLQMRRNEGTESVPVWVYSEDSTIKTITADALGPDAPLDLESWPGPLSET